MGASILSELCEQRGSKQTGVLVVLLVKVSEPWESSIPSITCPVEDLRTDGWMDTKLLCRVKDNQEKKELKTITYR